MSAVPRFSSPIRGLWIQATPEEPSRAAKLRSSLAQQGIAVDLITFLDKEQPNWPAFDLILFCAPDNFSQRIADCLTQIRAQSRAPILLLTESASLEWPLATLPAGADAVIVLETPDEVFLARCTALLRRWLVSRE
jgi:DNA-binding response OmpR family regulator